MTEEDDKQMIATTMEMNMKTGMKMVMMIKIFMKTGAVLGSTGHTVVTRKTTENRASLDRYLPYT